ncbi:fatty acid-binding protein 9-like [Mizuhopecten yessoensis]|uniref:Fatty acid-binding protein 9 n=1 Tax=Mizuhopecten yessoensis TaxID=6573 RepID=A0A210PTJ8_MIZYE|nr:fatty acid-binding protein 9-like [Mizuhopecten yessoensis]OWF39776.1 Fatty acid-binding protein 9 [Mizuhopecten yessoensis]
MEDIKEKFVGTWKMVRSENFEEFLAEVGVNFFIRKMAALAKPTTVISVEDETITIEQKTGIRDKVDTFKLNEKIEKEMEGTKMECMVVYEDGKLKYTNTPIDQESAVKPQTVYRERFGEELLVQIECGKVVCKRYFERVTA